MNKPPKEDHDADHEKGKKPLLQQPPKITDMKPARRILSEQEAKELIDKMVKKSNQS